MLGGSHSYGLSTPASDIDYRGVFINTELKHTIGVEKYEHLDLRNGEKDEFYYELRHLFQLFKKGNTQGIEMLFNTKWETITPEFELIREHRQSLIDDRQMYRSLKGYIQGERRLANGERQGVMGGKRRKQIEEYGFSPKNFVQLLRLCYCGISWFGLREFPVDLTDAGHIHAALLDIKVNPGKYTKDDLNKLVDAYEEQLDTTFDALAEEDKKKFDDELANQLICHTYGPIYVEQYEASKAFIKRRLQEKRLSKRQS